MSDTSGSLSRAAESRSSDRIHDTLKSGSEKLFSGGDLEWNEPSAGGDTESIVKHQPAKIDRDELLPLVERLIGWRGDTLTQPPLCLEVHEKPAEKTMEKRPGVSGPTIHQRLLVAYDTFPLSPADRTDPKLPAASPGSRMTRRDRQETNRGHHGERLAGVPAPWWSARSSGVAFLCYGEMSGQPRE